MADNTISPVVPNVSGGRTVSTGQKAVTQTAAQSGIDFKSYLGGRTAVQDNSTTFLKRRNSYTLNKNNTKEISIKTASESKETAGYTNLDDAVSRIKELEKQLDDANSKNQADAQTINDLNAQIQDLSTYKEDQAAFEEEKEKYYEEAVF